MGVERGRLDSEDRMTIERTEGKTVDRRLKTRERRKGMTKGGERG